jgi:hypothetical protein
MTPARLRALASHLESRVGAPSLDGYGLVDGLRAAADLIEGEPGPMVHSDCLPGSDAFQPRVSLAALEEEARLAANVYRVFREYADGDEVHVGIFANEADALEAARAELPGTGADVIVSHETYGAHVPERRIHTLRNA